MLEKIKTKIILTKCLHGIKSTRNPSESLWPSNSCNLLLRKTEALCAGLTEFGCIFIILEKQFYSRLNTGDSMTNELSTTYDVKKGSWDILNASHRTNQTSPYTYLLHCRVLKKCKHVNSSGSTRMNHRKLQDSSIDGSNHSTKAIDHHLHMTKHNASLSKLLFFDKTITWKLTSAVFLKKHHSQSQRQPCSQQNRMSRVFLLLSRTSVKRALEIGNNPLFYRAR